ncbi:hypothetical protein F4678DRAFT_450920 [Xylaria arbuscula]|nr:hypothetical protein F4678DRAFT_450920 [Xylaria arbuscula]
MLVVGELHSHMSHSPLLISRIVSLLLFSCQCVKMTGPTGYLSIVSINPRPSRLIQMAALLPCELSQHSTRIRRIQGHRLPCRRVACGVSLGTDLTTQCTQESCTGCSLIPGTTA